jgi:hypothetical protein
MEEWVRIGTPDTSTSQASHLEVFTSAGQPVFSGEFWGNTTVWHGTNHDGLPVASGIYILWIKTPVQEGSVKVALIRRN